MNQSFYKRFGLELPLKEWKERFMNRLNSILFENIEKDKIYPSICSNLCVFLWLDVNNYKQVNYSYDGEATYRQYDWIEKLTKKNFYTTLKVLEILIKLKKDWEYSVSTMIDRCLILAIEIDGIDLWIRFHNWLFYPSGNNTLDKEIIENSLDNIVWYKAQKDYEDALKKHLQWQHQDALTSCFTAIETLSKEILWNNKWLSKNKKEILKHFWWDDGFSDQWAKIINILYDYFNDYSNRHDWKERESINPLEVEATLYLTWLIINLLIKKHQEKK